MLGAEPARIPLQQELEIGGEGSSTSNESCQLSPRVKLSLGVAFSVALLVGFFVVGPVTHEGIESGATSRYITPFSVPRSGQRSPGMSLRPMTRGDNLADPSQRWWMESQAFPGGRKRLGAYTEWGKEGNPHYEFEKRGMRGRPAHQGLTRPAADGPTYQANLDPAQSPKVPSRRGGAPTMSAVNQGLYGPEPDRPTYEAILDPAQTYQTAPVAGKPRLAPTRQGLYGPAADGPTYQANLDPAQTYQMPPVSSKPRPAPTHQGLYGPEPQMPTYQANLDPAQTYYRGGNPQMSQGDEAVDEAPASYANLKAGAGALVGSTVLSRIFAPIAQRRRAARSSASLGAITMAEGQATANKGSGVDYALLICFALWYLGNYYYNITNKLALNAAGGAAGFPMTIATLQLGVGVLYAAFMWLAPDAREKPKITFDDYKKTLPVGLCSAGAHAASVFALSAGAVSFAQIVKAAEPAFAAVIGVLLYGAKVSKAKWLCLIPVIGGVILASLGELSFAWAALATAAIANVFAAVKANENKKLMSTEGLSDRIGSVGNQFAITTINAFLFCLPVWLLTEARKFGSFVALCKVSPALWFNMLYSGLWFYLYNELATMTIKKTGAVTQSVANTAKRVIVIIVVALVMGESLGALKLIGCGIGIGGVFLYSIIDKLVGSKK